MIKYRTTKKLLLLVFIPIIIITVGCNESPWDLFRSDYSGYLPDIRTLGVQPVGNDSAIFTAELISEGASPVDYAGFCVSSNSVPEVSENQMWVTNPGTGKLSIAVGSLHQHDVLYIRSFASNKYGFIYGNTVQFVVGPPEAPEVPCTLTENYFYHNSFGYAVTNVGHYASTYYGGQYEIYADCGVALEVRMYLMQYPTNGIYTTTGSSDFINNDYNVFGYVNNGGTIMYMKEGGKIYISDSLGYFSISICDVTTLFQSYEIQLKGNFKYH